ncbi:hypothetical protein L9F63_004470, partial [Diploptera punctata]
NYESTEKYEEFFSFNVFLLKLAGLYPLKNPRPLAKIVYNIYSALFFIIISSGILTLGIATVNLSSNLILCVETVVFFSGVVIGLADNVFFLFKKNEMIEIMKKMENDFISTMKPKYYHIATDAQKSFVKFGLMKGALGITLALSSVIYPLSSINDELIDPDDPLKVESWKRVPFAAWIPGIDVNEISGRLITISYDTCLTASVLMQAVSVDLTFLAMVNQMSAQFQYIIALFDNMEEEHKEWKMKVKGTFNKEHGGLQVFQDNDDEDEEDGKWYENYLKECIKRHQVVLE